MRFFFSLVATLLLGSVACQGGAWGIEGIGQSASNAATTAKTLDQPGSAPGMSASQGEERSSANSLAPASGHSEQGKGSDTPDAKLAPPTSLDLQHQVFSGLLATVPGYATLDLGELSALVGEVFPGRVPRSIQALVLLTPGDKAFLVLAVDTGITVSSPPGRWKGCSCLHRWPSLWNWPSFRGSSSRTM